ncbi:MAG: hypothetical protein COT16_02345 [Elusimicrobia bacterium CG08_land_8_20_14_0_20_44_26]|nr:MAG: hypothetical protein COT16_02345 [Elusimicrobia bacterium CG08_land_8_20_14_0_20_44_26]
MYHFIILYVNPVREFKNSFTPLDSKRLTGQAIKDGSIIPPSTLKLFGVTGSKENLYRRQKSAAFSNGVNQSTFPKKLHTSVLFKMQFHKLHFF